MGFFNIEEAEYQSCVYLMLFGHEQILDIHKAFTYTKPLF